MPITDATTAKTTSITNKPVYTDIVESSVGAVIDAEITRQSGLGSFSLSLNFDIRVNNNEIELKQSDNSYILLNRLIEALTELDHRTSFTQISSVKLKLNIAWD